MVGGWGGVAAATLLIRCKIVFHALPKPKEGVSREKCHSKLQIGHSKLEVNIIFLYIHIYI